MINNITINSSISNRNNINMVYAMMLKSCEKILSINSIFSKLKNRKGNNEGIDCAENTECPTANLMGVKKPFIYIIENSGIMKEVELSQEEVLMLKMAVNHNNGIINLCNRVEAAKSLFVKGLVHLSDDGEFMVVSPSIEKLIRTEKVMGCMMVEDAINSGDQSTCNIAWGNI